MAQLAEMIAKGETVPGIREIPNIINDQPPTESKLSPVKKPWEK
jgi:hypothetical protein